MARRGAAASTADQVPKISYTVNSAVVKSPLQSKVGVFQSYSKCKKLFSLTFHHASVYIEVM